jgi:dihydroorotate dehydrogenase
MALGMTRVFVPQDLEFMQVQVLDLVSVNPRLVPLIAHDRAGFGGALASCGVAIGATAWCAVRESEPALFGVLSFAGGIGFACAIGVHPWVGYMSLSHLLPALIGASTFVVGMVLLSRPMLARPS